MYASLPDSTLAARDHSPSAEARETQNLLRELGEAVENLTAKIDKMQGNREQGPLGSQHGSKDGTGLSAKDIGRAVAGASGKGRQPGAGSEDMMRKVGAALQVAEMAAAL